MSENLERVKLIKNRDEFIEFVKDLARYLEVHPCDQSELNVKPYLYSIAAWANDMDGYYQNHGEKPPIEPTWRTMGEVLLAALYYE